jgi:hypothetical protein
MAFTYQRRQPELSDLHRLVRAWYPAAVALMRERVGSHVGLPEGLVGETAEARGGRWRARGLWVAYPPSARL